MVPSQKSQVRDVAAIYGQVVTAVALPRSYHRVVAASGLANLADGIRMAAFPLLVATLTDSATIVALVFAAGQAPWVVFGLWAGNLADRVDRRQLARRVVLIRVVLLAALAVLIVAGVVPVWLVFVASFVLGISEVLADTATGVLIPSLVAPEHLERANSRMVGAQIAGNELIGPAIGGALFAIGASLPFFTNATLLAFAFVLLAGLPLLNAPLTGQEPDVDRPHALDGIMFIRQSPLLRTVTWSTAALAAVDSAWFVVLVLFVRDQLGLGPGAFGIFLAVGAVGGLAGAALADRKPDASLVTVTTAVFASMAISLLALGFAPDVAVTAGALVVTSGGFALWNVFVVSARQRATPLDMLGRVGATYRTIVVTASLSGAIAGGLLTDMASIPVSLIACGTILALLTPVTALQFRRDATNPPT